MPLRGRSSKVQNNVVTMHRNSTDKPLSVLLELQPLARNTVETLVTALRHVIETVANRMASSTQGRVARLIHCLVGDGIYTNNAAAAPVAPRYHARCEIDSEDCHMRRRAECGSTLSRLPPQPLSRSGLGCKSYTENG